MHQPQPATNLAGVVATILRAVAKNNFKGGDNLALFIGGL